MSEHTTQYNMPIVIRQFENGPSVPSIQCDHCAELIQEASDLIATWTLEQYKEPVFVPLLLHKACERLIKKRTLPTMEGPVFLAYLLNNIKLAGETLEDANQNAQLLQDI